MLDKWPLLSEVFVIFMALRWQMKVLENLEMEASQIDLLNVYFLLNKHIYLTVPSQVVTQKI